MSRLLGYPLIVTSISLEMTTQSQFIVNWKILISVNWDHTQVVKELGVASNVQTTGLLKVETTSWYLGWQFHRRKQFNRH